MSKQRQEEGIGEENSFGSKILKGISRMIGLALCPVQS